MAHPPAYRFCPHCGQPLAPKRVAAANRLACADDACGYIHWNNPIPVVLGLVEHRGCVILARNAAWPPGRFSLISGYVEANEAPADAIVREVKEELGLDAHIDRLLGCYSAGEKNQIAIAYALGATGELTCNEEIAETRLLSREELSRWRFDTLPITAAVVNRWLAQECRRK